MYCMHLLKFMFFQAFNFAINIIVLGFLQEKYIQGHFYVFSTISIKSILIMIDVIIIIRIINS